MKISSQEEYGLRCLVQVARHHGNGPTPISEIAILEGLSVEYVGKLLMKLRRGTLVESIRGKSGGYVLARPPDEITLRDALDVLSEPRFDIHDCERFSGTEETCVHTSNCQIRPIWSIVTRFLSEALSRVTLADVLDGKTQARRQLGESLPGIAKKIQRADGMDV